ncbi:MAG: hypothetical protein ACP5G1_03440 [Nanopusillaceae archaeon]
MEVLENEEIELKEEKEYSFKIENNPFFSWKKIESYGQELYYLEPMSHGFLFYILEHDKGIRIPEFEGKRKVIDYDAIYVTYKVRNIYVQVFIFTTDIYEKDINITIKLFFFW